MGQMICYEIDDLLLCAVNKGFISFRDAQLYSFAQNTHPLEDKQWPPDHLKNCAQLIHLGIESGAIRSKDHAWLKEFFEE